MLLVRREQGWSIDWTLGERDGLPVAEASTLVVDAAGQVLLSNPRGLWRVDPVQPSLHPFTRADAQARQAWIRQPGRHQHGALSTHPGKVAQIRMSTMEQWTHC